MTVAEINNVEQIWHPLSAYLFVPNSAEQYQQLVGLLDELVDLVGEDESHPLASLMDIIGVLIEKYEDEHIPELMEA